jgi:hypothetical protein
MTIRCPFPKPSGATATESFRCGPPKAPNHNNINILNFILHRQETLFIVKEE